MAVGGKYIHQHRTTVIWYTVLLEVIQVKIQVKYENVRRMSKKLSPDIFRYTYLLFLVEGRSEVLIHRFYCMSDLDGNRMVWKTAARNVLRFLNRALWCTYVTKPTKCTHFTVMFKLNYSVFDMFQAHLAIDQTAYTDAWKECHKTACTIRPEDEHLDVRNVSKTLYLN